MDRFNIPELHLMLGVGQKLYDALLTTMSEEEILARMKILPWKCISGKCDA